MAVGIETLLNKNPFDGRIALRTLVRIRWIAVVGQLATVLLVQYGLRFSLPTGPVLATIGVLALVNLVAPVAYNYRQRPGNRTATLSLGFDLLQLLVLLYLTGGLINPFVVLVLAPLTVAASVLSRNSVICMTSLALTGLAALLVFDPWPLPWLGAPPFLPHLYEFGIWVALSFACTFITAYHWRVTQEARRVSDAFVASQMALARQQRMSALGSLAAAAAHELGTPLGTIALVTKELAREISPDDPLAEDVALLQSEADRCRTILAELARKPEADGGAPFQRLPLHALVEAAAAPHALPHVRLTTNTVAVDDSPEPTVGRSPEILHGLGNLIQNALQFARTHVTIQVKWKMDQVQVIITDDGPGFTQSLLARLGEPYLSTRADGGGHMGLGIFIAQTLLERTGATLDISNRTEGGAQVAVVWSRPMYLE